MKKKISNIYRLYEERGDIADGGKLRKGQLTRLRRRKAKTLGKEQQK